MNFSQLPTPVATEMVLPNHSGVSSHPEAQNAFVLKAGDTMTGDLAIADTSGTSSLFLRSPSDPTGTYTQFAQSDASSVLRNFGSLPLEIKSATGDCFFDQTGVTNRIIIRNSAGVDSIIISDASNMTSETGTLSFDSFSNQIDMNSNLITNVLAPTNGTDAANKQFTEQTAIVFGCAL